MYVSAQCNFLDIISFSFKLGVGAHIQEQQKNVKAEMPAVMFQKDIR
jgi:hypothetical protein